MVRGYVPLLAIVAAVWGSSYLFIKVAVDEVEPTAMMFFRLVLASAVLVPVLAWHVGGRAAVSEMRGLGWKAWAIGFLNAAFPFTLIAWGEKYVDSGVAAIANASVPIFVVILAFWFNPSERVRGVRLAGILVGLAGVAVLTGPASGGRLVGDRRHARDRGRLALLCVPRTTSCSTTSRRRCRCS